MYLHSSADSWTNCQGQAIKLQPDFNKNIWTLEVNDSDITEITSECLFWEPFSQEYSIYNYTFLEWNQNDDPFYEFPEEAAVASTPLYASIILAILLSGVTLFVIIQKR